jgi:hypothetical protein
VRISGLQAFAGAFKVFGFAYRLRWVFDLVSLGYPMRPSMMFRLKTDLFKQNRQEFPQYFDLYAVFEKI